MLTVVSQLDLPLILYRYWKNPTWERQRANFITKLFEAMPFEPYGVVHCFSPPPGAAKMFKQTLVPVFEEHIKGLYTKWPYFCVTASSPKDFVAALEEHGCTKEGLPPELGGNWPARRSFLEWFNSRRQHDLERTSVPKSLALKRSEQQDGASSVNDSATRCANSKKEESDPQDMEVILEERKDRKRKMDVVYARKRRQREKGEEMDLQKQYHILTRKNASLKKEEMRLGSLVADAQAMVADIEAPTVASQPVPPVPVQKQEQPLLGLVSQISTSQRKQPQLLDAISRVSAFPSLQQQQPLPQPPSQVPDQTMIDLLRERLRREENRTAQLTSLLGANLNPNDAASILSTINQGQNRQPTAPVLAAAGSNRLNAVLSQSSIQSLLRNAQGGDREALLALSMVNGQFPGAATAPPPPQQQQVRQQQVQQRSMLDDLLLQRALNSSSTIRKASPTITFNNSYDNNNTHDSMLLRQLLGGTQQPQQQTYMNTNQSRQTSSGVGGMLDAETLALLAAIQSRSQQR